VAVAGGHTSGHGLSKPRVSHWDVLWRCVVCTTVVRHTGGGVAIYAVERHIVGSGGSEAVGEVVGAVVASTGGKGELVAGGVIHCVSE